MSVLADHVAEYLALRRRLGFKLNFEGRILPQFVAHLDASGLETVTVEAAVAWVDLGHDVVQPCQLARRLSVIRSFARWLRTIDPDTEVPPTGIWPAARRRPTPYLWSGDEVRSLLEAARGLPMPLRATTYEALLGLLAATGMRLGEATGLAPGDVDLGDGVITIRHAKFDRERIVPLHPTTATALGRCTIARDRLCPRPTKFFVTRTGAGLDRGGVSRVFQALTTAIGVRTTTIKPRIHDLRHSFAVRTLLDWHRAGIDVNASMPLLSTYLGHVNPSGTYWYLSASPELMELAAARLNNAAPAT